MKLADILSAGVGVVPCRSFRSPCELNFPCPEGEILKEKNYQGSFMSCVMRFRLGVNEPWQWRGYETNGVWVNYFFLEPCADHVLKSGVLSTMRHAPSYEYCVEGFAPLSPDSLDWLVPLEEYEKEGVIKWRASILRSYDYGRCE